MKAKKQFEQKDIYAEVTALIMAKLQEGVIPWRKTWKGTDVPKNYVTRKPYRGINLWLLNAYGFEHPYFLTFLQAKELGGKIKKGAKSIPVVYWNFVYVNKENGQKISVEQLPNYPKQLIRKKSFLKYYNVFNIHAVEGVEMEIGKNGEMDTDQITTTCQEVYDQMLSKPELRHGGNQAYYHPSLDYINMPPKNDFDSEACYYAVLFHELTHATGHKERLNKDSVTEIHAFGTPEYSKEELVAEMGAGFLCCHTGILNNDLLDNSSAYIAGWLKKLSEDKKMVLEAASKAQQAVDYILAKCPF